MPDQFGFRLPDLNIKSLIGGRDIGRLGLEVLTGQRSAGSLAMHVGYGLLGQLMDQTMPDEANAMAGQAAQWMREGRARWENWLRTTPQAVIDYVGDKGEGKTTGAFDTMDRFIQPTGRGLFTIGVAEELLPANYHALSMLRLREMGIRVKNDPDCAGQEIARIFRLRDHPEGLCVLIDDASQYLNSHAHQKPEAFAVQTIANELRHFRGILLATFQDSRDVGRSLVKADAYVLSWPNLLTMGPPSPDREAHATDRDEVRLWMDYAVRALAGLEGDDAVLTKFVACMRRDVMWWGPWRHQRPSFYTEALSRNKAAVPEYDDDVIEAEYAEAESSVMSGRFYCPRHKQFHWAASRQGQECAFQGVTVSVGGSEPNPMPYEVKG